jgi:magnesium-transporting ATPase (P-type)
MVGDGVNDVPALKEANMAVAMNDGAQIAKDVADIVLLDNSMATLPLAFARGKDITQKIFASARLFLTKNFYTVLAFIFIGFMALPFATTPILVSWLTFAVVNVPGGLIAFGLIKPTALKSFQQDVMRYVIAGALVGSVVMSLLYAGFYLYESNVLYRDVLTAQAPETAARLLANPPQLSDNAQIAIVDAGAATQAKAQASQSARNIARSTLYLYMVLFGLIMYLNTMGINLLRPKSLGEKPRLAILALILLLMGLLPPYFLPNVFEGFQSPGLVGFIATIIAFAVSVVAIDQLAKPGLLEKLVNPNSK